MTANIRIAFFALLLLLAGCASVPRPQADAPTDTREPIEAWARVLERFVDDAGRVDFKALAADRADLNRYVAWVYDHSPLSHPAHFPARESALAFHLNAYNALSMHNVIESGIPDTLAGFAKVRFFWLAKVRVGGQEISLYDYENKLIRTLGEPRVHFALNCMSVGCPTLPRVPFSAAMLETQLQRETVRFMNDPRHVRVDRAARTVWLSEIFDFFTADFLAVAPSLTTYANRYRAEPLPSDYAVRFIPYDWTVNARR
ncbi:MAG: DUF547 domain-containing protein [Betaproteobacteria bacterium]|nr:DUF547 domain-containing protein [Betaproteobacteria bacterium]